MNNKDIFPSSNNPNIEINHVCYVLINPQEVIIGYIDLTGRFPKRLVIENQYILIGYHYNTNHIRSIPIKNRKGSTITKM